MGSKKKFLEALDQVQELYPNMAVLSQLSRLLKDPNSDLEDLTKLVRTEPALTVDVIRVSNSPFYAQGEKCKDIQAAVARIGYNEVQRVVGLILARDICSNDLEKYGTSAHEFWAESVTVSVLIEGLARAFGQDPSEAATIGLLHAIGKVVINNILEDFKVDILWDPYLPVQDWETAMVGFNYAEAGARLLKRWEFPVEIIFAIGFHLQPEKAPKRIPMLVLLHYALRLSQAVGAGCERQDYVVPPYPLLTDRVPTARIRQIVAEAREAFMRNAELVFVE
jgi:HD-like signal output (HDOD) protein